MGTVPHPRGCPHFFLVTGEEWGLPRDPGAVPIPLRAYRTIMVQQRVHQQSFRERVIAAYRQSCAVCRLHRPELLEAAHILPDRHP